MFNAKVHTVVPSTTFRSVKSVRRVAMPWRHASRMISDTSWASRVFACVVCLGVALHAAEPSTPSRSEPTEGDPPTVYCSVDEPFARAVLSAYQERSGVWPRVVFDSEAGKTTGLVNRIITEAESGRARADVLWSGELFHTIRLARRGLLESYAPPAAADIPPRFRDSDNRWTAMAVRARVIAFDPKRTPSEKVPLRWEAFADPAVAPKVTIARPLFGTTHGHVAAMFALWGPDRGKAFLQSLADQGAYVSDGNSSAVRALMAGRVEFAMTDSDDVRVAARAGASVGFRYPDMGDGGTLLVPTSVALIRGGPSTEAAKGLIDFLVSAEVERMLAESPSGNIPVRESLRRELGVEWPPESKVSFEQIADHMDQAFESARVILAR